MALEREIPYCTILLVAGALTFHSMVLAGNLYTSAAMADLGKSTNGWSNVGLQLSHSLHSELDHLLSDTGIKMTQVIGQIAKVQVAMDTLFGKVGNKSDKAVRALFQIDAGSNSKDDVLIMTEGVSQAKRLPSPLGVSKSIKTFASGFVHSHEARDTTFKIIDAEFASLNVSIDSSKAIPTAAGAKMTIHTATRPVVLYLVDFLMVAVSDSIDKLAELADPVLQQIGKWIVAFGDTIETALEVFSTTIDLVQKVFDQMMSKATSTGKGAEQMQHDTFTLFDVSKTGTISVQDLHDVSALYNIEALMGRKADVLHATYDLNGDKQIDKVEFAALVEDPSVPGCMATVLRAVATQLSAVSGNVAAARMRDEVAKAVANYLTVISAKNITKLQWVSDRLTNASVPMAFTGDVLVALAADVDIPSTMATTDVGQLVVNEMYKLKPGYVLETLHLMSTPKYWTTEGYDLTDQPRYVARVTNWTIKAHASQSTSLLAVSSEKAKEYAWSGFGLNTSAGLAAMPSKMAALTEVRRIRFQSDRRLKRAATLNELYSSEGARHLRRHLLAGVAASATASDPILEQALNSGVPAVPATLEFAKFLSWNASQTAARFQHQCFEYSGQSSSTVDSFASKIKGMVKKISTFLKNMEEYSTPIGRKRFHDMLSAFKKELKGMVVEFAMDHVDNEAGKIVDRMYEVGAGDRSMNPVVGHAASSAVKPEAKSTQESQAVSQLVTLLQSLQTILPTVVNNLKDARLQVSATSEGLKSVFSVFKQKGPPIFEKVAKLYSTMWTAYFLLFAIMTCSVLFYGFWASGWCGGPRAAAADVEYEPPQTMYERFCTCCSACGACLRGCSESNMSFWSIVLLLEVVVLVLFVVSVVLCLLSGVKAFLSAGCAQVYIINDGTVCTGALHMIRGFVETFWGGAAADLSGRCNEETLLTCEVIKQNMTRSTIFVAVGSLFAAVFTFQMIVESAILHERARWRRIFDGASKSA